MMIEHDHYNFTLQACRAESWESAQAFSTSPRACRHNHIIIVTIIIIIIVTITIVITSMIIIISINTPFNICSERKWSITNCQKSLKHWFCQEAPFTPSASYSQSLHQHDLHKQHEHQNQNDHHQRFDLTPPTLRATLLFICRD